MKTLIITMSLLAAAIVGTNAKNGPRFQNALSASVETSNLADDEKGKGKCGGSCEKCKGGCKGGGKGKGKGGGCKGGCKGKEKEPAKD